MDMINCPSSFFTGSPTMVAAGGIGIIPISPIHGTSWFIPNTSKPFIPIAGAIPHPTIAGAYIPDTLANNTLYNATFINLAKEAYNASFNFSTSALAGSTILNSVYQNYLYKKLVSNAPLMAAYINIYTRVAQFYVTADPTWTSDEYFDKLNDLVNMMSLQTDKSLYIPNGDYTLVNGSAVDANIDAWKTAVPTLYGFFTIELYV